MDCYISLLAVAQNDLGKKVINFVQSKMTSIIEGSYTKRKQDGSSKNKREVSLFHKVEIRFK